MFNWFDLVVAFSMGINSVLTWVLYKDKGKFEIAFFCGACVGLGLVSLIIKGFNS